MKEKGFLDLSETTRSILGSYLTTLKRERFNNEAVQEIET